MARSNLAMRLPEVPWWVYDQLDDTNQDQVNWITGGLGSGKTYGNAIWHIQRCFDNFPAKLSWAIAPNFSKCDTILIPTFVEVLGSIFGWQEGRDFTCRGSHPKEIYLKHLDHVIRFMSANKWRMLVGENISHWSGSEIGFFQSRDWLDKIQARTRAPNAKYLQGSGEGTPEGINWWSECADFEGYKESERFKRLTLWTDDNTHLIPGYVDKIVRTYSYDPGKLESYRFGRFVPFTKGTAYWTFFPSKMVTLDVRPSPFLPIVMSWDFGIAPYSPWVALQHQTHKRRWDTYQRFVVLAESTGKARGLDSACAEFRANFPESKYGDTPIIIDGGADGYAGDYLAPQCGFEQIRTYLSRYYRNVTVSALTGAPTIQASLERVAALFSYEYVVVAAWCRELVKGLTNTSLKDGTWEFIKKRGNDPTHYPDALRAALFRLTQHMDLEAPDLSVASGFDKRI